MPGKGRWAGAGSTGISPDTKVKDAAWRLIRYLGGKDAKGEYFSAKDWYLKYGVGYPFKSLDQDPDIQAAQKKTGYDLEVLRQQFGNAHARENIRATWYSEWDRFTQQQIQSALLRQIKPARSARRLGQKGPGPEEERRLAGACPRTGRPWTGRPLRARLLPIL